MADRSQPSKKQQVEESRKRRRLAGNPEELGCTSETQEAPPIPSAICPLSACCGDLSNKEGSVGTYAAVADRSPPSKKQQLEEGLHRRRLGGNPQELGSSFETQEAPLIPSAQPAVSVDAQAAGTSSDAQEESSLPSTAGVDEPKLADVAGLLISKTVETTPSCSAAPSHTVVAAASYPGPFTVPAAIGVSSEASSSALQHPLDTRKKILVIDNRGLRRTRLAHVLRELNPRLLLDEFSVNDQQILTIERNYYDLIIIRHARPDMDAKGVGWFLSHVIEVSCPIIVLSQRLEGESVPFAQDCRITELLNGPFSRDQVSAILKMYHLDGEDTPPESEARPPELQSTDLQEQATDPTTAGVDTTAGPACTSSALEPTLPHLASLLISKPVGTTPSGSGAPTHTIIAASYPGLSTVPAAIRGSLEASSSALQQQRDPRKKILLLDNSDMRRTRLANVLREQNPRLLVDDFRVLDPRIFKIERNYYDLIILRHAHPDMNANLVTLYLTCRIEVSCPIIVLRLTIGFFHEEHVTEIIDGPLSWIQVRDILERYHLDGRDTPPGSEVPPPDMQMKEKDADPGSTPA